MNWKQKKFTGWMIQEVQLNRDFYSAEEMSWMAEGFMLDEGYAQYEGHYDGWERVRVTRDVRTKMGQAFLADDVTVGKKEESAEFRTPGYVVFSWRNGFVDTVVSVESVEVL